MKKITFTSYEYLEGMLRFENEIEVEETLYEEVLSKLKELEESGNEDTHEYIYRELYHNYNIDIKQLSITVDEIFNTDSEETYISSVK